MIVHHDDMQIMCVCSCICTVAHGYSQLHEGLKVHRPVHTCTRAPARTFHGTHKLATTAVQLYNLILPPVLNSMQPIPSGYIHFCFCNGWRLYLLTFSGYTQRLYPFRKISGYNRSWPCIGYTQRL